MKKSIFLLLSFSLLLFTSTTYGQTLSQQLGGATTDFQFTLNGNEMDIVSQVIIPKGEGMFSKTHGYGYGSQIFQLEFITKTKIESEELVVHLYSSVPMKAKMTFYAADGLVLWKRKGLNLSSFCGKEEIVGTPENKLFLYSISLEEYSIALLEKVAKIDFQGTREISEAKKRKKDKKN